jgi:uncharacterized protein
MTKKVFKILTIDGGGIKGLYSASVLAKFEEKTGKKAGDYFDMICGTSTGGLIALGLACNKDAKDLVDIYYKHGNKIFPSSDNRIIRFFQNIYRTLRQTFWYGKFSNKALKSQLDTIFKNKKLGELDNLVIIPSFNLVNGMPRIFKFPHKEGEFFMDRNIPVVDAALATSAAPTYFPIHKYDNFLFVDGGVWANNPSLCGLLEAIEHFVGEGKEYDTIEMLSIPSISQPSGWIAGARQKRSFIGWGSKLFQTSMDGQAYFTHFFLSKTLNKIVPNSFYYRLESPKLSIAQMEVIDMDKADSKALNTLKALGDQDGVTYANKPEVLRFFETPKTYNTKK